jgi:DNA repair protein RecN (Recombination protein N)
VLRHLRVGNLALAADVAVELGPGLTMLTGETGAGKSLIAGALALLAGGKAQRGQIRQGEDMAFVEGVFDLEDRPQLAADVRQAGLRLAEDGVLVLRRELRSEGRGRVLINGLVSSLAVLEEFGGRLLVVQSQDQQRELARAQFAGDFLDRVLGLDEQRAAVATALAAWRELIRSRDARRQEAVYAREQLDMWRYQHRELAEAGLDPDEEATLREKLALGRDLRGVQEAAGAALQELVDGEPSAVTLLGRAAGRVEGASGDSERLAGILAQIVAAQEQAGEAARDLERFVTGLEIDPARLDEMEARLSLYSELCRKYDRDLAGLADLRDTLAQRLDRHQAADADLAGLEETCRRAEAALADACLSLREARTRGASGVARDACALIRPLALPQLAMDFIVTPDRDPDGLDVGGERCRVTATGADRVTLTVRPNAGEAAGDVARIASGGEKSRLYLGLTVLARRGAAEPPLELFDEVDAGLGMDHARDVADLLSAVAQAGQVLCITHLPTVAARGDRHLRVAKRTHAGRTEVVVEEVTGDARVAELARLLGGDNAGEAAHRDAYARELLQGGDSRAGRA